MKSIAIVTLCVVTALGRQASLSPTARIQVWVVNTAGVPPGTLSEARRIAGRIFHYAGIEVDWIDCLAAGHPCRTQPQPSEFWLQILKDRPLHMDRETAGYALLVPDCRNSCSYAAASWPTVLTAARSLHADADQVLGLTIAHELCHLLMGAKTHERDGIMAPRLGRSQIAQCGRGMLFFSSSQAEGLRQSLSRMLRSDASAAPQREIRYSVPTNPSLFAPVADL